MIQLILWSFIAYGMTTIIVYGAIFEKPRNWIKINYSFLGELISCPLCTSTWVGFFLSLILGSISSQYFDRINVLIEKEYEEGRISEYCKEYIFWNTKRNRKGMPPMSGKNGEAVYNNF